MVKGGGVGGGFKENSRHVGVLASGLDNLASAWSAKKSSGGTEGLREEGDPRRPYMGNSQSSKFRVHLLKAKCWVKHNTKKSSGVGKGLDV